jgi:hypothetical protein
MENINKYDIHNRRQGLHITYSLVKNNIRWKAYFLHGEVINYDIDFDTKFNYKFNEDYFHHIVF